MCPTCGVVYEHGAYHWKPRPAGATEHVCPACRRIADEYPAGYLTLQGEFPKEHRDEIVHLLRNEKPRARSEHALERIIDIRQEGDETPVTTTDIHLPRRMRDAVSKAYRGELRIKYAPDEYRVRVYWQR